MTKEKSIEFLQSCLDKVKNASEEDITFYKHRLEEDSKNKKSVLVIDTPETCIHCPLLNSADECTVQDDDANFNAGDSWDELIKGCPLKELPERRKYGEEFFNGDVKGWNDCLKTILGENKNV